MRYVRHAFIALALLGLGTLPVLAQSDKSDQAGNADAPHFVAYPDEPSVTYHTTEINGEPIYYEATAGTITLVRDEAGDAEPRAQMFYIAYRRTQMPGDEYSQKMEAGEDVPESNYPNASKRPLTFSFNGGPGSSSVWLHLGVFGPKKVAYADDEGRPGPPPYRVESNPHSLLDKSDFVFIDPVSTGFSRAQGDTSAKDFHGLETDIASVAAFIKRYITSTERWSSPLYIAGESYGTTRAAGLTNHLQGSHGISVNGVILVSAVIEFSTLRFGAGNDLPYICFFPSFAATAHYHGALPPEHQNKPIDEFYKEAEAFALGDYASALIQGARLSDENEDEIVRQMSEYLGLTPEFIRRANLRISQGRFCKELLRDQGLTVGRFDSRFTGQDRDDVNDTYDYDPSYAVIRSNFTESFNSYIREELGFKSDLSYEILTNVRPWDYGRAGDGRYVNVAERLRSVMHEQPHIRVFVASGYHDLATPPLGLDYTHDHMQLRDNLHNNLKNYYYIGGHMMYLDKASLEQLKDDLDAFYDSVPVGLSD
ncbi:MAG: peptidase S10 [Phycisphaera sp.]|nr:MAG: peptidase S10 [Phycisphaera sp.]